MKSLFILLLSVVAFGVSAQTKTTASTQQNITFRLLPVAVVERVSADAFKATKNTKEASVFVQAGQKWVVQSKKLTASEEQMFTMFSNTAKKNRVAEDFSSLQVLTMSKP